MTMKNKVFLILAGALMAISLVACNGSNLDESKSNAQPESEDSQDEKQDNNDDLENVQSECDDTEQSDDVSSQDDSDDVWVTGSMSIDNNGGHFLGVNDNLIYYIESGEDAKSKSKLFGEYINSYCGTSKLMAYDCYKESSELIKEGTFYGRMYALGEDIFVNSGEGSSDDYTIFVTVVNPSTKNVEVIKDEYVIGGDSKGDYVVTEGEYNNESTKLYVRKNEPAKLNVGSASDSGDNTGIQDQYTITSITVNDFAKLIGIEDGYLVVAIHGEDAKRIKCYDLNDSNKEYDLGMVPDREIESFENYPEYEQCVINDGKVYLRICWYEGTGHFFAEQAFVTADLKTEGSLTKIENLEAVDNNEEEPDLFKVENGKVSLVKGIPDTAYLDYVSGDYGYFDKSGEAVKCGTGFGIKYDADGEITFMNECAELVNDRICIINNDLIRDPDNDIGWRYAYTRKHTDILFSQIN